MPDGVLGFMVLNTVNFSDESEKLIRAAAGELQYVSMKNKILQIFSGATSGAERTPDVKLEPNETFYGLHNSRAKNKDQKESYGRGGNQSYHRGYQGRRQFRGNS